MSKNSSRFHHPRTFFSSPPCVLLLSLTLILPFVLPLEVSGAGVVSEKEEEPVYAQGEEKGEEPVSVQGQEKEEEQISAQGHGRVEALLDGLTLDQKIAQMLMPSIRSWEGENVTDLSLLPDLSQVLTRHPFGGLILFGSNIESTEQTFRLVSDLQLNHLSSFKEGTPIIPYFISADQEGGIVTRLSMGTRGSGSMALGACVDRGEENAYTTGQIFGQELSCLGINVNLAPCIDLIGDLADPGMSTRVYSDDPQVAARLGIAFGHALEECNVIPTFKHFPGAGDGSDGPTSCPLTLEELRENGLSAYQAAIDEGAQMLMVSAITFPQIDQLQLMADGVTQGYYPATLSKRIVTELLRQELGFEGVVMTDALEMLQFVTEPDNGQEFFPGELGSIEHDLEVAQRAIMAGCDILLIPRDLISWEAAAYYEEYIQGLVDRVEEGQIPIERIDQSVERILSLKERYGILDMDPGRETPEERQEKLQRALEVVGSEAHHAQEFEMVKDAITLLKNEDGLLPLSPKEGRYVILAANQRDHDSILYAIQKLKELGALDPDTYIQDRLAGESQGKEDAPASFLIDTYEGVQESDPSRLKGFQEEIEGARAVICISRTGTGLDQLQDTNPAMQGLTLLDTWAQSAHTPFILLCASLPVDAARFQDAQAIVCAYLASRAGREGERIFSGSPNVPTALLAIFGMEEMPGRLPINLPVLERDEAGNWGYGHTLLYERGFFVPLREGA